MHRTDLCSLGTRRFQRAGAQQPRAPAPLAADTGGSPTASLHPPRSASPTGGEGWGATGSPGPLQSCSWLGGQAWCHHPGQPPLVSQCCCPELSALPPHAATGARSALVLEPSGRRHRGASSAAFEQGAEFAPEKKNLMQCELMAGRRRQAVPSWAAIAAGTGSPVTVARGSHPSPDTIRRRGRSTTGSSGCAEAKGVNPGAGRGRTHDAGAATACGRACRRRRPRGRW